MGTCTRSVPVENKKRRMSTKCMQIVYWILHAIRHAVHHWATRHARFLSRHGPLIFRSISALYIPLHHTTTICLAFLVVFYRRLHPARWCLTWFTSLSTHAKQCDLQRRVIIPNEFRTPHVAPCVPPYISILLLHTIQFVFNKTTLVKHCSIMHSYIRLNLTS